MIACALIFLLGLIRPAEAQEFRHITLSDGRTLDARVDATTADGLTLSLPQGTVRVPFSLVMNIEEMDESLWRLQPAWQVLVLPVSGPPELSAQADAAIRATLARLPSTGVLDVSALAGKLDPASHGALVACVANLDCALPMASKAGVTAMISVTAADGDPRQLSFKGVFVATPTVRGEGEASISGDPADHPRELLTAGALSLLVMPTEATLSALPARLGAAAPVVAEGPTEKPEKVKPEKVKPEKVKPEKVKPEKVKPENAEPGPKPPEPGPALPRTAPTADHLRALAWVPLPGAPSLARRDMAGFAASWGLTLPGSAALIYGAGRGAMTRGELIGLSVVSCYGMNVASNLIFGLRAGGVGAPISASVLPTRGGAAISVSFAP